MIIPTGRRRLSSFPSCGSQSLPCRRLNESVGAPSRRRAGKVHNTSMTVHRLHSKYVTRIGHIQSVHPRFYIPLCPIPTGARTPVRVPGSRKLPWSDGPFSFRGGTCSGGCTELVLCHFRRQNIIQSKPLDIKTPHPVPRLHKPH